MAGLRVLVADDHPLMREGVRQALAACEEFEVVAEADSGSQVLPLVSRHRPDLVLLDIRMPGRGGLDCLDVIRARHPEVKVVMLSVFSEPDRVEMALKRGASGYIVKSVGVADLASALRQTVEGTVYHAVGALEDAARWGAKAAGLSERETEILEGVARGLSNRQIARELWVTEQTVKFHLTNLYRKLNVGNRTEAAGWAHRHLSPSSWDEQESCTTDGCVVAAS